MIKKIKAEIGSVNNWRAKAITQAQLQTLMVNYKYNEQIGLPMDAYSPEDVQTLVEELFKHMYIAKPCENYVPNQEHLLVQQRESEWQVEKLFSIPTVAAVSGKAKLFSDSLITVGSVKNSCLLDKSGCGLYCIFESPRAGL